MTDANGRLSVNFVNFAGGGTLVRSESEPWQSLDLAGERHRIRLRLADGCAAESLVRSLPDHEFGLPGLLVADAIVTAVDRDADGAVLTIEALTFDEP